MRTRLVSAFLIVATASAVRAQTISSGKSAVFSVQPISTMLTFYSGEAELAMSPSATIGIGGSHLGVGELGDNFTYTSGDLKLRYYPDARAFQGFSFGASVGMTRVTASSDNTQDSGSATKPTVGVFLDYNWLLGASKSFYVGMGAGAKKLFIGGDEFQESVTASYPTVRMSVGWAF